MSRSTARTMFVFLYSLHLFIFSHISEPRTFSNVVFREVTICTSCSFLYTLQKALKAALKHKGYLRHVELLKGEVWSYSNEDWFKSLFLVDTVSNQDEKNGKSYFISPFPIEMPFKVTSVLCRCLFKETNNITAIG